MTTPGDSPIAADEQALWARLLISSIADAGVTDVVVSPGSRSTPLVLAAHHEPRMRCWDVVDERSAGFFALGMGSVRGFPALVFCTSGTAGAHYLPAVIEASMAHVPLLIITADRPIELVDCGANQTIDQVRLFGHHARAYVDVGRAESTPRALRALQRTAARAVLRSVSPSPGAVHLNMRFRKPLDPSATGVPERSAPSALTAPAVRPVRTFPAVPAAAEEAIEGLAAALVLARRPLIVAGPAPMLQAQPREAVMALAVRAGAPLLVETTSQLRSGEAAVQPPGLVTVAGFDALLRAKAFRAVVLPDLVIQLGRAPIASGWSRWAGSFPDHSPEPIHWVVAPQGWHDPESTATAFVQADTGAVAEALVDRLEKTAGAAETGWLGCWRAAEEQVWRAVAEALATEPGLSEGSVSASVVNSLDPGSLLALGNSLVVRQVDTWSQHLGPDIVVWHQRGASGIDGLIAGACGAASVSGRPTTLLLGDVSFLHDVGSLAVARDVEVPLTVVVVDNGGGRIFEQLPIATHPHAKGALHHWVTPHDTNLGSAAEMFGLSFMRCTDRESLCAALAAGRERVGCTLIQAVVPAHGAATANQALWHDVDRALGSAP